MAIVEKKIEGVDVTYLTTIRPQVGEYGVYQDKIWKVLMTEGVGKTFRKVLMRPLSGERVVLQENQNRECCRVLKPTGHISI